MSAVPTAATGAPGIPASLVATAGVLQVALSWAAAANATSYNIYRQSGGQTPTNLVLVGSSTTNSYTDTGLTAGTTYFYQVTGVN